MIKYRYKTYASTIGGLDLLDIDDSHEIPETCPICGKMCDWIITDPEDFGAVIGCTECLDKIDCDNDESNQYMQHDDLTGNEYMRCPHCENWTDNIYVDHNNHANAIGCDECLTFNDPADWNAEHNEGSEY